MLPVDNQLRMTEKEWVNLSTLTFEPLTALKRRLTTVVAMRAYFENLLADCSGVTEEIELLRRIFLPMQLERLRVPALQPEADKAGQK